PHRHRRERRPRRSRHPLPTFRNRRTPLPARRCWRLPGLRDVPRRHGEPVARRAYASAQVAWRPVQCRRYRQAGDHAKDGRHRQATAGRKSRLRQKPKVSLTRRPSRTAYEQWARIEPLLPTDTRGMPRVDDRRVLSGIVQALKSGGRWGDCPEHVYGPKKTLYNRFRRWAERGVWERIFTDLAGVDGVASKLFIDSSCIKVHR